MIRKTQILIFILFGPVIGAATEVDFARQVLPILSDKCFVCHGPDAKDDNVRLDSQEGAAADLGGYKAIDSQHPEKSEVLGRINSTDDPMPPMDAEKQLTESERKLIADWIAQGGEYAKHWAFIAPRKQPTHDGSSPKQIDHLIQQQLQSNKIDFAPLADKATLARRSALVLTGLPPEEAVRDAFLSDSSSDAYSKYVDRLMSSSRFGEHQARYWLDAVRYGDTHGLHLDNRRGIYPYRDWVVKAFNDNLPLDQFITWQVAGDLLDDPTLEQLVATGFVRMNPSTGEGGAIPAEFQAKNNFDRVETFGTVFLGLSLTCARCHTHKYDPIQQTEYYRFMAFFNSTAEPALDGNSYTYGPTVKAPGNGDDWNAWDKAKAELDSELRKAEQAITGSELQTKAVQYAKSISGWKNQAWKMTKPLGKDAAAPTEAKQWVAAKGLPGAISGRAARGKLPAMNQAVWVQADLELPADQTLWIEFSGAVGSAVFVDDQSEPIATKKSVARVTQVQAFLPMGKHRLRVKILGHEGMSEIEMRIINAWDSLTKSSKWNECSPEERLLIIGDKSGPLHELSTSNTAQVANKVRAIKANFTTTLVAKDIAQRRETRVLARGEYDKPEGEALTPGVMAVMNPMAKDAPQNRLGLAMWLTSPENPLVARVLVNRIWQRVFGEAIVRSPEDFGLQGQQPTHPELLDWLAVELVRSNWDVKHLLKLMVTSRTFQQQSTHRADIDDPENRLFARGPSFRLDAEVLRDLGLWSSGLLDPEMGGEGVKPYQPSGMWQALAHPASNTKQYQQDSGKRLYRRSLYVYWKRTSPHPMMTLFDAPDRESSCVRRSRTSTALQSLGLLNETQRIEMSRVYAGQLLKNYSKDEERLRGIFMALACRPPSADESNACMNLLAEMRKRYASAPDDAKALLQTGLHPSTEQLPLEEHAAWTQLCVTILASDLAIMLY